MNAVMTRYLVLQAEAVRGFFADAGPAAVREAAAARRR